MNRPARSLDTIQMSSWGINVLVVISARLRTSVFVLFCFSFFNCFLPSIMTNFVFSIVINFCILFFMTSCFNSIFWKS